MRKVLLIFTLSLLSLTASAQPNELLAFVSHLARVSTPTAALDRPREDRPQWESLGMEDLLVAGEESSITAPASSRVTSRTHGQSHAPRASFNGTYSRPSMAAHATHLIHPVPYGRFSHRPADYFIFYLSVMRR